MREKSATLINAQNFAIVSDVKSVPTDVLAFAQRFDLPVIFQKSFKDLPPLRLRISDAGLSLEGEGQTMLCDLKKMLPRLKASNLSGEMLVKAAKIKKASAPLTVVDATAGLGEDSLLLAAAGFQVKLFERNPLIALLLRDALQRASAVPELLPIVQRMQFFEEDSIRAMPEMPSPPDVVFLDPMFPEKEKTALAKKKFQLLHCLELPASDENELFATALSAKPYKIVIKRPLKGAFLCGRKPDYSLVGKAIRYDCFVFPENDRYSPQGLCP